ncbi:MAG: hypothetical protein ACYC9O_07000 [Candidatus Latescibacterota bacterium]
MSERAKRWILGICLAVFWGTLGVTFIRGNNPQVDETDYRAVAQNFILHNANIARKIGKVQRLDHFGVGGEGGSVSYNVYRLTGAERDAVCHVTLSRDERSRWRVTKAILTMDGVEYIIPIQRADTGRTFRIF